MARLIAAKCPTCGANLSIDPSAEFALCQYCSTTSFVRTKTRPVSRQLLLERSPVIDLARPHYGWLIAVVAMVTVGSSIALAAALLKAPRAQNPPAAPPTPPAPGAAPDVSVSVANPGASTATWQDSGAPVAVPESSSMAREASGAGGKPAASAVPSSKALRGRVAIGRISVSGRLDPVAIRSVIAANSARFRMCYEQGLGRTPKLAGRVAVRFVIGRDGTVVDVSDAGSDLADAATSSCVLSAFYGSSFPLPERGIVTVTSPLIFSPG